MITFILEPKWIEEGFDMPKEFFETHQWIYNNIQTPKCVQIMLKLTYFCLKSTKNNVFVENHLMYLSDHLICYIKWKYGSQTSFCTVSDTKIIKTRWDKFILSCLVFISQKWIFKIFKFIKNTFLKGVCP